MPASTAQLPWYYTKMRGAGMIGKAVLDTLADIVGRENILLEEPMKKHTSFRIGGPAECLVMPECEEQVARLQRYLNLVDIPYVVIGNGSNLLVSDEGVRGVLLAIGHRLAKVTVEGRRIHAQAGALLSQVAAEAAAHGLSGLEFAAGIPGSVGGGAVMNAGAYDGEMSQVVSSVTVVNVGGEVMELDNSTMEFGYRRSVLQREPLTVTGVTFLLHEDSQEAIRERMADFAKRRREKQPLELPSAGSTFKRPEGHFAGQLIMEAGLRGYRVGGAQVSEKHCGFVVNVGGATAADVKDVIAEVQTRVKDRFGVELEPEIRFV